MLLIGAPAEPPEPETSEPPLAMLIPPLPPLATEPPAPGTTEPAVPACATAAAPLEPGVLPALEGVCSPVLPPELQATRQSKEAAERIGGRCLDQE